MEPWLPGELWSVGAQLSYFTKGGLGGGGEGGVYHQPILILTYQECGTVTPETRHVTREAGDDI